MSEQQQQPEPERTWKYEYEITSSIKWKGEWKTVYYKHAWPSDLEDEDEVAEEFEDDEDVDWEDFIGYPTEERNEMMDRDEEPDGPDWGQVFATRIDRSKPEPLFTVWVGGVEVNDRHLTGPAADALADTYRSAGYDDVAVEEVR